ncbi:hypothetical protein [Rhodococcus sp. IEGM1428]|uniref:hypothetical protein n=1 Tax=Rhodococcus sp. IEGM1428 TaxID=3392191 RepID=UPI003D0F343B
MNHVEGTVVEGLLLVLIDAELGHHSDVAVVAVVMDDSYSPASVAKMWSRGHAVGEDPAQKSSPPA